MDGTGGYYAKRNQRKISYDFTHMRTLRYKTDEHQGRETKNNIKTGRRTKHKRLLNMENKGLLEGLWEGGWAKWIRGIKESNPEIIVALYAN